MQVLGFDTYKPKLGRGRTLLLYNVLYAPKVQQNLFLVIKLLELGFDFNFHSTSCKFYFETIFMVVLFSWIYFFILDIVYSINNGNVISYMITANDVNFVVCHARLGHIRQDKMNRLARDGLLAQIVKISLPTCKHCVEGKSTRKPFGKETWASIPS